MFFGTMMFLLLLLNRLDRGDFRGCLLAAAFVEAFAELMILAAYVNGPAQ